MCTLTAPALPVGALEFTRAARDSGGGIGLGAGTEAVMGSCTSSNIEESLKRLTRTDQETSPRTRRFETMDGGSATDFS